MENTVDPSLNEHYFDEICVMIFKTNIRYPEDLRSITPIINSIPFVSDWTVDSEDIDCVLRIESEYEDLETIIQCVTQAGYICEELPD